MTSNWRIRRMVRLPMMAQSDTKGRSLDQIFAFLFNILDLLTAIVDLLAGIQNLINGGSDDE